MKMKRIWWGFLMIAAVAFLAGCGGGGGGTSLMVGGERATQLAIDALETSLAAAEGARNTAQGDVTKLTTELDTANMNAMDLQGQLDTANQNAMDLQARIDTAEGDITSLTTMRDNYRTQAANLQTMLDDENDMVTQLTDDLAVANQKLADIERVNVANMAQAARDDRMEREMRLREAITDDTVSGENRIPASYMPKTGPTAADSDVAGITVTRSEAGNVNIDVNGMADDDYDGGSIMAGSGSWNPAKLIMRDEATKTDDELVIYTDIDEPGDQSFTTKYSVQAVLDDIFDPNTDTALTTDEQKTDRLQMIMASRFPSASGTTWTYDGTQGGRSKSVPGTFDGVPGQFTCTDGSCMVTRDGMGNLSSGQTWRFTPDSPNTATVKQLDAGYAWFRVVAAKAG